MSAIQGITRPNSLGRCLSLATLAIGLGLVLSQIAVVLPHVVHDLISSGRFDPASWFWSFGVFALPFGAIAGALSIPAIVFALKDRALLPGIAMIYVASAIVAYFTGRMGPLSAFITFFVLVIASKVARMVLPMLPVFSPGACQHCGYDLRDLASAKCPECGEERA